MPTASDNRWWTLDLVPGWEVVPAELAPGRAPNEEEGAVAIVPHSHDAALRVFARDHSREEVSPRQWVEFNAHVSTRRGWSASSVTYGPFSGAEAREIEEDVWWHIWWLAAPTIALNALYRCALEIGGRDDPALYSMLATLRFARPAG